MSALSCGCPSFFICLNSSSPLTSPKRQVNTEGSRSNGHLLQRTPSKPVLRQKNGQRWHQIIILLSYYKGSNERSLYFSALILKNKKVQFCTKNSHSKFARFTCSTCCDKVKFFFPRDVHMDLDETCLRKIIVIFFISIFSQEGVGDIQCMVSINKLQDYKKEFY